MAASIRAFDGLRVLDFSTGMVGPLASMVLAEFGAEVIKVESPAGDCARIWPVFAMWNRGKRSVVLDLTTAAGLDSARQLAAASDVVLENFRPEAALRFGLSYADLAGVNPALVHCSISGFGDRSPFAGLKAYEGVVAAALGLWSELDDVQGRSRRRIAGDDLANFPTYKLAAVSSYAASQLALHAIIAALLHKQRTGSAVGQRVRTSLAQGAVALLTRREFATAESSALTGSAETRHRGRRLAFLTAQCSDGKWIQMCARQDQHFHRWLKALGLGELALDERFAGGPVEIPTIADVELLEREIRARMLTKPQHEWMDDFFTLDVPADPFLTPTEFLDHPQLIMNNRITQCLGPDGVRTRQPGPLVAMSDTPASVSTVAPRLGEHTDEVLSTLAASAADSPGAVTDQLSARRVGSQSPSGGETATSRYPLAGVVVLELAYYIAAPLAGSMLAQLGARVIKLEPLGGDPSRRVGVQSTPLLHGKESIALDLGREEGRAILQELIRRADVLYTNFRPQAHEKLSCDYATVHELNPNLVYLYAASYGSVGPWSQRAAFHSTPNALSGCGIAQAGEGNPPVDDDWPDPVSGLAAATAILAGLAARERSGTGQYLETTMLCSSAYAFSRELLAAQGNDGRLSPLDCDQRGSGALDRLYRCRTGWLLLQALSESEWRALAEALHHPEWVHDARFSSSGARATHNAALSALIQQRLSAADAAHWQTTLTTRGVASAWADQSDAVTLLERAGLIDKSSYGPVGDYWRAGAAVDFSDSDVRLGAACLVGEHTSALLGELGYSRDDVLALQRAGVVATAESAEISPTDLSTRGRSN